MTRSPRTLLSLLLGEVEILTGARTLLTFWQSHLRINVECAFGELVQRWGILWRPLHYKLATSIKIVQVVMRLHNLCVSRRVELEKLRKDRTWGSSAVGTAADYRWHSSSIIYPGDRPVEDEESCWGGARRGKPSHEYRKRQTELLRHYGILRPSSEVVRPLYTIPANYPDLSGFTYVPVGSI